MSLERARRNCGNTVQILTVNVGEAADVIEEFLAGEQLELRMLRDATGEVFRKVGGRGLPMNLVCRGGERKTLVGPLDVAGWRDQLRALGCNEP